MGKENKVKKTTHLYFIIILILVVSGCRSIAIDSIGRSKESKLMVDSVYIKSIKIKSFDELKIEESFCRMLMFSLGKRNFKTSSYLEPDGKKVNYQYYAELNIFLNTIGDELDSEISTAIFFKLYSTKNNEIITTIRLSCRGCDIKNSDDQIDISDKIAERLDE